MKLLSSWRRPGRSIALAPWAVALVVAAGSFVWGAAWARSHHGHAAPSPVRAAAPRAPATPSAAATVPAPLSGEFEAQSALLLGSNGLAGPHARTFVEIVRAAHRNVRLIGLVRNGAQEAVARALLERHHLPADAVRFVQVPMDTMWVRDYGPVFVRRRDGWVAVVEARYVPEGAEFVRTRDDELARAFADRLHLPLVRLPLRLEWGNILSNGEGLCVAGATVISHNVQHTDETRQVGRRLAEHLGFRSFVILRGPEDEPTGHVDMLVTFLAPDVAVVGRCDAAADPQGAASLDEAAGLIARQPTSRGPMKVHRVPMPAKRKGQWRSYTNVVFANGVLLVPSFSDVDAAVESEVLGLYATLLPGWRIAAINCDSLEGNCGFLHCVCMNVPGFVDLSRLGGGPAAPEP